MRIDLTTPFAEKDAAKALGARWDSARRNWYVVDPQDLTPFLRWIPDLDAAKKASSVVPAPGNRPRDTQGAPVGKSSMTTGPADVKPHCGCDVLPWMDCIHSEG